MDMVLHLATGWSCDGRPRHKMMPVRPRDAVSFLTSHRTTPPPRKQPFPFSQLNLCYRTRGRPVARIDSFTHNSVTAKSHIGSQSLGPAPILPVQKSNAEEANMK